MKTWITSCVLCLCGTWAMAQTKTVLTELVVYKVNLRFDSTGYHEAAGVYEQMNQEWYLNKIPPAQHEKFAYQLHEAASAGKIKVYSPFYTVSGSKPVFTRMAIEDIIPIGNDTIYKTLQRPYPPYDDYDTVLVNLFDVREITQLLFMEKWTFNTKTRKLKKEIIAYAPYRTRYDLQTGEFRGMSCMYWIKCRK